MAGPSGPAGIPAMGRYGLTIFLGATLFLVSAPPLSADTSGDVAAFAALVEGRFDNALQTFWAEDPADAGEAGPVRWSIASRTVAAPSLGGVVVLWEARRQGESAATTARRAFVVSTDETPAGLRVRAVSRAAIANIDEARAMAVLGPDAVSFDADCEGRWRRDGDGFAASAPTAACAVAAAGAPDLRLGVGVDAQELRLLDPAAAPDAVAPPLAFRRVRPFECWTAVLPGAAHGDGGLDAGGEPRQDWVFRRGGRLHDQNGVLAVDAGDTSREIRLRLRRVVWPTGPNRPSLTLYVEEGASTRALSYAWAEYDAERIGINLRWLQASCTHAPDTLWTDEGAK